MPLNGMNYEDRGEETRYNSYKLSGHVKGHVKGHVNGHVNGHVSSHVSSTDLVNGTAVYNGISAAATKIRERGLYGTEDGVRPHLGVNGNIRQEHKGKRRAVSSRTVREKGCTVSAVADASASGRVNGVGPPGGDSVNRDSVPLPCNSDQMMPKTILPGKGMSQRRWGKFKHKKRDTKASCPESSALPPVVPQEEDWEKEIQEVALTGWDNMCFGISAYGPEDLLHFSLRDLILTQQDTVPQPVTANYTPSKHHPRPIKWSCYNVPSEPDQFADADE